MIFPYCVSPLCLARTHVDYQVKDDVAVVRINDPNSKVHTCFIFGQCHVLLV